MSSKKKSPEEIEKLRQFVFNHKRFINKTRLAETLGCDDSNVSKVIRGERKDNFKILETAEKIILVQL